MFGGYNESKTTMDFLSSAINNIGALGILVSFKGQRVIVFFI